MASKSDYAPEEVKACKSVLVELIHLFGEIKDEMVIIGGWTPALLFPQSVEPHIGSLDIDVALNFAKIPNDTYQTILKSFLKRGYVQDKEQPFRFYRTVALEGMESVKVAVDLMAGEYGGTGKSRRTQSVQDARARKARGCDLAFNSTITVTIEEELPGGGMDKVSVKVAGIVPFLVMKGMAMHERLKEKDAYDIYFCLEHYAGGVDALVREFKPHLKNKLVMEGLGKIRSRFATMKHVGPVWVADFMEKSNKEEREILMRRVYEKVTDMLDALKIKEWAGK
ncbi:MAG: hypothetical protein AABZ10_06070 [Nitrospirota bacterium]